jgi:uncharacterized protein YbbK (DUF523 family)
MMPIMEKYYNENEAAVKDYCAQNCLNFELLKKSPKSCGVNDLYVQYYEEGRITCAESGVMLGSTPMPVMLKIFKTDNGLRFEQTEHTAKYLAY